MTDPTVTEPGEAQAAVADLLAHLELRSVAVLRMAAERRSEEFPDEVAVRLDVQPADTEVGDGWARIRYVHRATFTAGDYGSDAAGPAEGTSGLGQVTCAHEVVFSVAAGVDADEGALRHLAEADAYFMAYPYVRQTLQALAEGVGLPPVLLPVLRRGGPNGRP